MAYKNAENCSQAMYNNSCFYLSRCAKRKLSLDLFCSQLHQVVRTASFVVWTWAIEKAIPLATSVTCSSLFPDSNRYLKDAINRRTEAFFGRTRFFWWKCGWRPASDSCARKMLFLICRLFKLWKCFTNKTMVHIERRRPCTVAEGRGLSLDNFRKRMKV